MILKIERYNRGPKNENDDQRYWMFDSVRKYSLSNPIRKQQKTLADHDYDAIFMDMVQTDCTCDNEDECDSCIYYNVLICRLDDGSEYSIAFDTVCYVLNDNGKTIEKIVANY
jgi:hypothetical protein